jgi:hypothetical protein
VTLRVTRRADGAPAVAVEGGLDIDAEREWIVEGSAPDLAAVRAALPASVVQPSGVHALSLVFGNGVGRYAAGPLGVLRVRSGKWCETDYDAMLDAIAQSAAALPFHAGAASALPYARTEVDAPDVLYHAFVWLRHVMVERSDAPLACAGRPIARCSGITRCSAWRRARCRSTATRSCSSWR